MRYFILISVLFTLYGTAYCWETDWEFDRDLSCCLQDVHLQEHFIIKLETEEQPVGHMAVTTPESFELGVNLDDVEYFLPPKKQGLYALGPRPNTNISSEKWDFTRYILIFRRKDTGQGYFQYEDLNISQENNPAYKLPTGKYKLQVKGTHLGKYRIIIFPQGTDDPSSAIYWPLKHKNIINSGELHTVYLSINKQGKVELANTQVKNQ